MLFQTGIPGNSFGAGRNNPGASRIAEAWDGTNAQFDPLHLPGSISAVRAVPSEGGYSGHSHLRGKLYRNRTNDSPSLSR